MLGLSELLSPESMRIFSAKSVLKQYHFEKFNSENLWADLSARLD